MANEGGGFEVLTAGGFFRAQIVARSGCLQCRVRSQGSSCGSRI